MKLREYILCAKKTKRLTLFNNLFSVSINAHSQVYHDTHKSREDAEEKKLLKLLFLFSLHTKSILVALQNYGWTTDVTWTILTMSLLPFWALDVSVALLYICRVRMISDFIKNIFICEEYLNSKDERRSNSFGTTCGWVINDWIFIFGLSIPSRIKDEHKTVPLNVMHSLSLVSPHRIGNLKFTDQLWRKALKNQLKSLSQNARCLFSRIGCHFQGVNIE